MDFIFLSKALYDIILMLMHSLYQIICYSYIQSTISLASQNINIVVSHTFWILKPPIRSRAGKFRMTKGILLFLSI